MSPTSNCGELYNARNAGPARDCFFFPLPVSSHLSMGGAPSGACNTRLYCRWPPHKTQQPSSPCASPRSPLFDGARKVRCRPRFTRFPVDAPGGRRRSGAFLAFLARYDSDAHLSIRQNEIYRCQWSVVDGARRAALPADQRPR